MYTAILDFVNNLRLECSPLVAVREQHFVRWTAATRQANFIGSNVNIRVEECEGRAKNAVQRNLQRFNGSVHNGARDKAETASLNHRHQSVDCTTSRRARSGIVKVPESYDGRNGGHIGNESPLTTRETAALAVEETERGSPLKKSGGVWKYGKKKQAAY
ncbi:hypothetical protein BIW11_07953 [Tropilaelaps mercedesae]|uniref:Uncharacterized protein n=1 Tax=Tropilaelaps mercedesae TaxID=418985 RepID=A0A1V9XS09_9ACAR|nr:hypothetical protein BIW11_07953 [Tropilaelaps mercedesae]